MWRFEMNENSEETGKWVVVYFFSREPMQIYGLFDTQEEAHGYAMTHGKTINGDAYSVHMVFNAHYQEDPSDYVGMGWVDSSGRP
jgi:hypothetical protein